MLFFFIDPFRLRSPFRTFSFHHTPSFRSHYNCYYWFSKTFIVFFNHTFSTLLLLEICLNMHLSHISNFSRKHFAKVHVSQAVGRISVLYGLIFAICETFFETSIGIRALVLTVFFVSLTVIFALYL